MTKRYITYGLNFKYCFRLRTIAVCVLLASFLCLSGSISEAWSQQKLYKVESISFSGNQQFSSGKLSEYYGLSLPGNFDLNLLTGNLKNIIAAYRAKGYYYAKISSAKLVPANGTETYIFEIRINEGKLFRFDSVSIEGIPDNEAIIVGSYFPVSGEAYSQDAVENGLRATNDYYSNSGFPYVIINISYDFLNADRSSDEIAVRINLDIAKNKTVYIDSIEIEGLDNTNADVIVRESRITKGEIFSEKNLRSTKKYLENLSYLSDVEYPTLYEAENGKSILMLSIKEKNANNLSGIAGYVPATGQNGGYIVGSFDVKFGNLFGTGREFQVEWQKHDRASQNINIFYKEPWAFGLPVNINGLINQSIQDSSYTKRSFSIGFDYQVSSSFTIHALFGGEQVITDPAALRSPGLIGSDSRSSFYSAGVTFNSLDSRTNPRKGVHYTTYVTQQHRKTDYSIDGSNNRSFTDRKIVSEIELAFPAGANISPYLRGVWKQITSSSDLIPVSQKWFLGGARSLRGYREKQFLASRIAWFNFELRYLLGKESRIFMFLDGGFLQNKNDNHQGKYGYGFGLRTESRLGIIGFDLGLGMNDTFSSTKLHLVIQNSF